MNSWASKIEKLGAFLIILLLLQVGLSCGEAAAQLPDLAVSLKGPPTAFVGEDIGRRIEVTVKNTGGTDARGFYVDIILVEPNRTEHLCARERIENMPPKKSVRLLFDAKHPVPIPGDIKPGEYQLCVLADPTDVVREAREKNNRVCRIITLNGKDF